MVGEDTAGPVGREQADWAYPEGTVDVGKLLNVGSERKRGFMGYRFCYQIICVHIPALLLNSYINIARNKTTGPKWSCLCQEVEFETRQSGSTAEVICPIDPTHPLQEGDLATIDSLFASNFLALLPYAYKSL